MLAKNLLESIYKIIEISKNYPNVDIKDSVKFCNLGSLCVRKIEDKSFYPTNYRIEMNKLIFLIEIDEEGRGNFAIRLSDILNILSKYPSKKVIFRDNNLDEKIGNLLEFRYNLCITDILRNGNTEFFVELNK